MPTPPHRSWAPNAEDAEIHQALLDARAAGGEVMCRAEEDFYHDFFPSVLAFVKGKWWSRLTPDERHDAATQALFEFLRMGGIEKYDPSKKKLFFYLITTAMLRCTDCFRRKQRRRNQGCQELTETDMAPQYDKEGEVVAEGDVFGEGDVSQDVSKVVQDIFDAFSDTIQDKRHREVFRRYYIEGKTNREIAGIMQESESNVSRWRKGIEEALWGFVSRWLENAFFGIY